MPISIIIPTLNEADRIGEITRKTRALGDCEIIVVDGDSDDGTLSQAREADLRLSALRGRGPQQNAGARAAEGDVLLFLHADCWLEPGSLEAVNRTLQNRDVVGGGFRQTIEADGLRYRLLEWGNAQRIRLWKWAYGDQGIFVRREAFERLGGFPETPLMEDLLFMKRLKRMGRVVLLDQRIRVSPRRWQRNGVVRQTLRNWSLVALAHCGVPPERLAQAYPDVR